MMMFEHLEPTREDILKACNVLLAAGYTEEALGILSEQIFTPQERETLKDKLISRGTP